MEHAHYVKFGSDNFVKNLHLDAWHWLYKEQAIRSGPYLQSIYKSFKNLYFGFKKNDSYVSTILFFCSRGPRSKAESWQ